MVRPRKTPGLEAGAAYGEVGENLAAMNAMPIAGQEGAGTVAAPAPPAQPAPQVSPVEAARGFTPKITPLLAPGENRPLPAPMVEPTAKQRSGELLQSWAAAIGDPIIMQSASQLMSEPSPDPSTNI